MATAGGWAAAAAAAPSEQADAEAAALAADLAEAEADGDVDGEADADVEGMDDDAPLPQRYANARNCVLPRKTPTARTSDAWKFFLCVGGGGLRKLTARRLSQANRPGGHGQLGRAVRAVLKEYMARLNMTVEEACTESDTDSDV